MRPAAIFLCALFCAGRIQAQEIHTSYEFLGFSEDLKYCAFEVYDYAQLEEPAFSKIFFIDVDKNDYSMRPVLTQNPGEGQEALDKVRADNRKKAEPYFKSYKISGKKLGTPIPFRYEETDRGALFFDEQKFEIGGQQYSLLLSNVPTGEVATGPLNEIAEVMVVVDLNHNGKRKRLQPATKAPQSWGFIMNHMFLTAYYLQGKIAVFVEYQGPGFEGYPDRQQMIVTGVLN